MITPFLSLLLFSMGTRTVSALSLLALSLNATAAMAAEPAQAPFGSRDMDSQVDLSQAYLPEAVYVTSVAANVTDTSVAGSFTVENTEDVLVTGLQYRLELRGTGKLDGLPYAIDVVRASLALAPQESKKLLFATALPNVPAGRYDLRVQLLTAKGRALGWQDTPVVVTAERGATDFVTVVPGTIGIAAYGDELLPPLSGPNVDPSGAMNLRATAINDTDHAIRVTPVIDLYDFNAARVGLGSLEYSDLNVAAGETVKLDLPVTADAVPGTYMAHLTLKDADTGETLSSIAQYRYVVKGEDADIVSVRIENMGTKAGDWAYGTVDMAGAADALTTTVATLRVQLTDDKGTVGSIDVPGITLADSILSAKIRIPLSRDLVGAPSVDASLLSDSNTTYDHVTYAGTLTPAQLAGLTQDKAFNNWVAWHGLSRIALFAFIAMAMGYALFAVASRMRASIAFARAATAAFLLVAFVGNVGSAFAAGSGGIETLTPVNGSAVFAPLGNRPIIALFVNSPVHGQANNFCNRQIQLSYRLEYGVCENEIAYARVVGRVTRNGGLISAYDVPGTAWDTVHNRTYQSQFCNNHFCFQEENFSGMVDLTNIVDQNANTATLQLLAKWGKNLSMPDASFDRTDPYINLGWAHALNIHLQCTPPQLNVTKTVQSGSATPGSTVTYTFAVTNGGQTNAPNVTLNDIFLNGNTRYMPFEYVGANGATCSFDTGAVQLSCTLGALTPGQTKTFTASFRVPQNQPQLCGQTVRNRAEVRTNNQSTGSASAEAQVNVVCPPSYGCVEVFKEGFTSDNQRITGPLPSFTFKLDNQITTTSDQNGFARFENVQPGTHSVSEIAQSGWTNFLITPQNGFVTVQAGSNCAGVTVKNRQDPQDADLQLAKTGPQTVVRGSTATYALTVKNNGPVSATNTIVRDTIPAGTSFNAAQSDTRCSMQGNSVACNVGTLTPGQTVTVSLVLNVANPDPASCAPGTIVNQAAALSDRVDNNLANNQSSFTTQATCPQPQVGCIEILKEGFTSDNQRITGALPAFSFKLDGNQTVQTDALGRATLQNVTPGQHTVTELTASGWTNFLVTPQNGVVNVQAGTACAGVTFKNRQDAHDADLSLVKTGPASVTRGTTATYALAAKNNGPTAAPNTIVRDELPAGTTFNAAQSDNRCTLQGNSIVCNIGTLAIGQTITLSIALNVPSSYAGATLVNRAAVLSDLQDPNLDNNQSVFTSQVAIVQPQVGCIDVFKEGFDAGGSRLGTVPPFTFILDGSGALNVHTNSAGSARFVNVPAGQHTVSEVTASGWTLFNTTPTGGVVNVAAGSTCAGVVFKNRQQPLNADVSIVKSGPATAVRGGNLTYSLTVTNNGPAVAQNVMVDDQLPSGLGTPVVSGAGCTVNNGLVHCVIGPMNVNDQRIITINVPVPSQQTCQPGSVTNTATVTSQNDSQAGNNASSVTTQLQCPTQQQADLLVQKTGPASVVRGQNAQYTILVKNNGPAASPNTIVGDPLPAGTTFVAAQSDNRCQLSGNTVFCNLGTMALNQQITFTLTLNVTAQAQCQAGTLLNRASVLGDLQDPFLDNNQSTFTSQVTCPSPTTADVSVAKTGPSTVVRGTNLSYGITVSNLGPATASGIVLSDAVPAGLTLVSSGSGCLLNNGVVTCQIGALPTAQTRTYSFVYSTGSAQNCAAGTVTNVANVTSTSTDPNTANNQSTVTTQITCPSSTGKDVQIAKTGPSVVTRGENFTYTLTVTNNGPATATGVVVTDVLPSGLTFVSTSAECQNLNGIVTCQAGTIAAAQSRAFSVTVVAPAVGSCTQASVTNTATVTSSGTDNNVGNNSSSLTTQVNCPNAQLGCIDVIKETYDTNGNVLTPVTQFTFNLDGSRTAVNDGQGRARFENVALGQHTVTENLPSGWTQLLVTPSGGLVNVTAGTCVAVSFKNKQTIQNSESFSITKTDHETEVEPGDTLEYEIRVRNNSSVRVTNVTVTDTLPDEVEFQDASPNESSENGRVIRWENQTFEANEEKLYRVEVDVDDDADGTLYNTAEVRGVSATDRTDVDDNGNHNGNAEIDLTKTASTSEVFPGGIIDYTVRVRNTGDDPIENLTVTDQLPADVIVIDDGDADSRSGRRLEWEIDELDDGDEEIFRYRVSVPTYMVAGQIIRNNVCVEADDLDNDECESVTVSVLGMIPKTGAKAPEHDAHLTPVAAHDAPSDGTPPFFGLIALAGAATGAGLGFGRKMLFGI